MILELPRKCFNNDVTDNTIRSWNFQHILPQLIRCTNTKCQSPTSLLAFNIPCDTVSWQPSWSCFLNLPHNSGSQGSESVPLRRRKFSIDLPHISIVRLPTRRLHLTIRSRSTPRLRAFSPFFSEFLFLFSTL